MTSIAVEIPEGLHGLSADDARRVLRETGPNRWVRADRWRWLLDGVAVLLDPMAVMLAIAASIYFLLGETRDATLLAAALVPVLGVDVLLEARSRAALAKLAQAANPVADVVRDTSITRIALEQVVPGDLLLLREGHVVAADGVVRWAANLTIDESLITGESEPQAKQTSVDPVHAPRDARCFAGSVVTTGHGYAQVTATGTNTQYGGIAALVRQTLPPASPLQQQTGRLVRRLGGVALVTATALAILSVVRGAAWTTALLSAVSLAMAAIPEEFPIVLTLFLSVGAWRLASRGMLVRRLAAVETLGATSVICTDKTGTLTRGEFQLVQHVVLVPGLSDKEFLETSVLACEQSPADAMERAIRAYAERHGADLGGLPSRWALIRDHDFDAVGKHMSHVWADAGDRHSFLTAAKGAVEGILAHAVDDAAMRRAALDANSELAAHGMRVLAVAAKVVDQLGAAREDDERNLKVYGLLAFQDPLRPEVRPAVDECQRAGIHVKMITGDHALTAHAVAEAAGIAHEDDLILTGDELAALSHTDLDRRITRASIFARTSPEQKFVIVDALKRTGAIVAMTGDGVNDAPALRRADIGIAMGQRGTDVARATADLVLLDDNFASIVDTVREGRHIFQNIQQAFLYLIAFHIPIVALAILAPLAGLPLLLLPVHLVWLELIVHPVSAFVFQSEPASSTVMQQPPRDPTRSVLPASRATPSVLSGIFLAMATFGMYWWQSTGGEELIARTLALVVLLSGYQMLLFAERMADPRSTALIPRSSVFWMVWTASAASLVVLIYVPALSALFHLARPQSRLIVLAVVTGAACVSWRILMTVLRGHATRRQHVDSPNH